MFTRDQIISDLNQLLALFNDKNLREQAIGKIEELKGVLQATKLDKEYKDLHINVMEDMRKDVKVLVRQKLGISKIDKMLRDAKVG